MSETLPRRLAAIMFTDIVGYSALTQKDESLALSLLQQQRDLLRPIFSKHGGAEIKTIGDAFLVEFDSALEAARCAIDMQKMLAQHNATAPADKRTQIRIGVHLGDVVHKENDVYGDGVNIASRIEPLADPGGICVSEDVANQIQNKIDTPLVKLGEQELRNISVPIQIYKIVLPWEESQLPVSDRVYYRAGAPLGPGRQFGPYKLIRLLGKGGMGEVYEAESKETGRRVALKVLSQQIGDPVDRQRFLREGRLAASINHPNSVYIFGTEKIEGTLVISMELTPGGTLKDRIKEKGPMSVSEAVDAILQVITGLEAAHEAGILHRDIKPSNCFIEADGTVKIGDFGLSISTLRRDETQLTASGSFLGTPAFASPEQLRAEDLDVRSDIYSVGATLYYLLTTKPPFDESNLMKLLTKIGQESAVSPSTLRPEIPKGLSEIIQRALQKDPSKRFSDYSQMKQQLILYSSSSLMPAGLLIRFWAGFFDWILLTGIAFAVSLNLRKHTVSLMYLASCWTGLNLIVSCVSEGVWGTSIGKFLCGLCIIGPGKSSPGFAHALVRSSIYSLILLFSFVLPSTILSFETLRTPLEALAVTPLCFFLFWILCFVSAHTENGYTGLHDYVSGTRVMSVPTTRLSRLRSPKENLLDAPVTQHKLGPYSVIRVLRKLDDGVLDLGYDSHLQRNVWIHHHSTDLPPIPATRRNLSRPTRLRWLNGRRSPDESWDAYEALDGRPFLEILSEKQSWSIVRHWLLDLNVEFDSALKDGSVPAKIRLDQVWITQAGTIKLLDFALPKDNGSHSRSTPSFEVIDFASSQVFLAQIATSALEANAVQISERGGTAPRVPLPLYARRFLEHLNTASFTAFDALQSELRIMTVNDTAVPRRTRVAQIGVYLLVPIFFLLASLIKRGIAFITFELPSATVVRVCLGLALISFVALLTSLTLRGGLAFFLTGVALVTKDGRPISRIRALFRSLIAWWLPWIPFSLLAYIVGATFISPYSIKNVILGVPNGLEVFLHISLAVVFVAAGVWSIVSPMRGPADIIAGTFLVPSVPTTTLRSKVVSRARWRWSERSAKWALALEVGTAFCLGAGVYYIHHRNLALLENEIERLRAAGEPTDFVAWMAPQKPVNGALQEEFWKWQYDFTSNLPVRNLDLYGEKDNLLFTSRWAGWAMGEQAEPPKDLEDLIRKQEPRLRELRQFLSHDELINGSPGWLAYDLAQGKSVDDLRAPSLLVTKWAVSSLGYSAMLAQDPFPFIKDMDNLLARSTPSRTLVEFLIAIVFYIERDSFYVGLESRNHLPEAAAAEWLSRSTPYFIWASDAMHTESLQYYQRFRERSFLGGEGGLSLSNPLRMWISEPAELEHIMSYHRNMRSWLVRRAGTTPDFDRKSSVVSLESVVWVCFEAHNLERLSHLAVKTHRLTRNRKRLPLDEDELLSWLKEPQELASGRDEFRLRYEKLTNNRFRLSFDPRSPLPDYYPQDRKAGLERVGLKSHFGELPSEPFWKNNNTHSLEIEIPKSQLK